MPAKAKPSREAGIQGVGQPGAHGLTGGCAGLTKADRLLARLTGRSAIWCSDTRALVQSAYRFQQKLAVPGDEQELKSEKSVQFVQDSQACGRQGGMQYVCTSVSVRTIQRPCGRRAD